jgi:transposase-like protein
LYRAIDRDGNLLVPVFSEDMDRHAARLFLRRLLDGTGKRPFRVTIDKHPAYTSRVMKKGCFRDQSHVLAKFVETGGPGGRKTKGPGRVGHRCRRQPAPPDLSPGWIKRISASVSPS